MSETRAGGNGVRYDVVFLDVDGTILWTDLDVEGYVSDLAPYTRGGDLTAERAAGPVWASMKRHIEQNIEYRTEEDLADFRRRNAGITASALDIEAPVEVLTEVAERRISFNPYPESERVMEELRAMGCRLYAVSNWDLLLEEVLEDLDWMGYFESVVASAVVGVEKPERGIFEEALRISGSPKKRTVMVGNDPVTDVRGATGFGLDAVMIDRKGNGRVAEATAILPDLSGLPELVRE
ncbi:MAG: HAD family hydrolase [Rubrobacteraceae bacterium]